MYKRENKFIFDAGKVTWLWSADKNDSIHLRLSFGFDHKIDECKLLSAWKKTMKVYPLLDCIPNGNSGHMIFSSAPDSIRVIEIDSPVTPCTELSAGRGISLSYHDDVITLAAYHSLMDGTGMISVVKTLIYNYCCIYFGENFDSSGFMITENRNPEEYYKTQHNIKLGKYTPMPMATFPENEEFFFDPQMKPPAEGKIISSCLSIPVENFIAFCKKHKATPSVMLCILFGRAAYGLSDSERRSMAFAVTMDLREATETKDAIGQFSASGILTASYDEIMNAPLSETASSLRSALNKQRSKDYIKTSIAMFRTYDMFQTTCSAVISYEGKIDFGSCGAHIQQMSMLNNTSNTLHMVEFKNNFLLFCQFGLATERYMNAIFNELKKADIDAKIVAEPKPAKQEITDLKVD